MKLNSLRMRIQLFYYLTVLLLQTFPGPEAQAAIYQATPDSTLNNSTAEQSAAKLQSHRKTLAVKQIATKKSAKPQTTSKTGQQKLLKTPQPSIQTSSNKPQGSKILAVKPTGDTTKTVPTKQVSTTSKNTRNAPSSTQKTLAVKPLTPAQTSTRSQSSNSGTTSPQQKPAPQTKRVLATIPKAAVNSDGRFHWYPGMDQSTLVESTVDPVFYQQIKQDCLAKINHGLKIKVADTTQNVAILEQYLQCLIKGLSHEIMGLEAIREHNAQEIEQAAIILKAKDPLSIINNCYNLPIPQQQDSWSYNQLYYICQEYLDKTQLIKGIATETTPTAAPSTKLDQMSIEQLLAIPEVVETAIAQKVAEAPELLKNECSQFRRSIKRYTNCLDNTDYYINCIHNIQQRIQEQNVDYNRRCLKRQSTHYPDSLIGEGYSTIEGPYISRQMLIDLRNDYLKICLFSKQQNFLTQINNIQEECRIIYQRYQMFTEEDNRQTAKTYYHQ